jgi:hypothetical protein
MSSYITFAYRFSIEGLRLLAESALCEPVHSNVRLLCYCRKPELVKIKVQYANSNGPVGECLFDPDQMCARYEDKLERIGKGQMLRGPVIMTRYQYLTAGEYTYLIPGNRSGPVIADYQFKSLINAPHCTPAITVAWHLEHSQSTMFVIVCQVLNPGGNPPSCSYISNTGFAEKLAQQVTWYMVIGVTILLSAQGYVIMLCSHTIPSLA